MVFMFSIAKAAVSNFMAEIEGRTITAEVSKNSAIQVLNLKIQLMKREKEKD
jgi:hypothetical protein